MFRCRALIPGTLDAWLKLAFYAMLVQRFVYPYFNDPLQHIFSDPGRHWENGKLLFHPSMMASVDPKLYQVWMWFMRLVTQDNRIGIALFTGVLCAALPWLWYKCCREFMPRRHAYIFALILGLCPMLMVVFGYFMNETLQLVMLALAMWLTLRAKRKQEFRACMIAGIVWIVCLFTRSSSIPFMLLGSGYLLYHTVQRVRLLAVMAVTLAICVVPAGMHSYVGLHVFSPFQFDGEIRLILLSEGRVVHFDTDNGYWIFSNPTFYQQPLYPFHYESSRPPSTEKFVIKTQYGRRDWDKAIADAEKARDWTRVVRNTAENAIFFMLGEPWPDSSADDPNLMMRINYRIHWLWPILMVMLALKAPRIRVPAPQMFILTTTLALTTAMLVQQIGLVEGRYRKPLEPFLLLSAYLILVRPPGQREGEPLVSMYRFVLDIYIMPFIVLGREAWAKLCRRR